MLQQTPVVRVLPVHEEWLRALADPGRPGRGAGRRGGAGVGPARLPAPGPAAARRGHRDRRAARRRGAGVVRRPARPARRRRLHRGGDRDASPTGGATSSSTPTSAGCSPARRPAPSSRPPSVTKAERGLADGPAARGRADRRDLVGGGDGARRARLHGGQPAVRGLPGRRPVRLARRRPPGVRRAAPQGADLGRHRPPVPRPAAGRAARRRRRGHRGSGSTRPGRTNRSGPLPGRAGRGRPGGPHRRRDATRCPERAARADDGTGPTAAAVGPVRVSVGVSRPRASTS